MAFSAPDQAAILKELLDAVKTLQLNQVQLSSAVDAISGRVNVLAGMKEVRDVAIDSSPAPPVKKSLPGPIQNDDSHHDHVVPSSPSRPASQFGSSPTAPSPLSHVRKQSVTSKIILTWVSCKVPDLYGTFADILQDVSWSIRYQPASHGLGSQRSAAERSSRCVERCNYHPKKKW
jgi:hypothetical protein